MVPLARPPAREQPATQPCALTGNRTSNSLLCRMTLRAESNLKVPLQNNVKINPILQMSELRNRLAELLVHGHTGRKEVKV